MRFLTGLLALFPLFAGAQNLGTYQITGGDVFANSTIDSIAGDGFTGTIQGYPAPLYAGGYIEPGTGADFSMNFRPPGGFDQGAYLTVSGFGDVDGLAPVMAPFVGVADQSGSISVSPIDITGAGAYTASFVMSADVDYGPPGSTGVGGNWAYLNFVGTGTVTVDVLQTPCNPECGPLQISSVEYVFAPEFGSAWTASALTLLAGGLLVLRSTRQRSLRGEW